MHTMTRTRFRLVMTSLFTLAIAIPLKWTPGRAEPAAPSDPIVGGAMTGTIYFSDGFESGAGNWVRTCAWAPTQTTSRAGTSSLTDSPGANYLPGSDCSATLAPALNLSASADPVLVFWHKGAVGPGDLWSVEVSSDGGLSWVALRQWSQVSLSTWSQEQVGLQGYQSGNFKVRFRLTSNSGDGEADGWYIDDVEVRDNLISPATPFPFTDTFEGGLANWTVSGRDWATTGAAARAGSFSLTDSPGSDYPANADCSATLARRLDLTAAAHPVLVFWHKGVIGPGDLWSVEVSSDGGTWWLAVRQWSGWAPSTWSQEQVDLESFATGNVKVRFRLTSNAGDDEADGWYIDDVEVRENLVPPATPFPFTDTFEGGLANWTVSGQDWAVSNATSRAGVRCLTDSPGANYLANANCSATLARRVDLTVAAHPVLVFWHKGSVGPGDLWSVEVSSDGGTTWTPVRQWSTWIVSTWSQEQVDLEWFRTNNVKVRFRVTADIGNEEADGWYVDDVEIRENMVPPATPFPFAEAFESGLANWTVSGRDWGVTSAGPHAGSGALTDSPAGSYAPFADFSASLAHRVDLSGAVQPVLLFWHRGAIGPGDYWSVDVSSDGGNYWTPVRQWSGWQQSNWSLEQVDLQPYRSSNVKVRFRLISNFGDGEADGWYIDDVRIQERDPLRLAFPFADDFEGGLGNWLVDTGGWNLTTDASRSRTHSLTDSPAGDYQAHAFNAVMLAHPIDLIGTVNPVLQFWHRGTIAGGDAGYVQVSPDGGTSWYSVGGWSYWEQPGFSPGAPYPAGGGDPLQFDLRPYRTGSVQVRFLLQSGGGSADGWYVDDVRIREVTDLSGVPDDDAGPMPAVSALGHAWPNPFNPATTISFDLSQPARVRLAVYDAAGRRVRTLADESRPAGRYEAVWDGRDDQGRNLASGVYLCRMDAGAFHEAGSLTLIR